MIYWQLELDLLMCEKDGKMTAEFFVLCLEDKWGERDLILLEVCHQDEYLEK